jgi:cytochrome P450
MSKLPAGPSMAAVLLATLRPMPDHTSTLRAWADRYGDPFTLRTPTGPVVLTTDPEAIRTLYTADPETFVAAIPDALEPMIGANSLLLTSGPRHTAARKLLAPPFHGARMRAYGRLMRDATLRWTSRLTPGARFSAQELAQDISLEVILRAVFGVTTPEQAERFHGAVLAMIEAFRPSLVLLPSLRRLGDLGPWGNYRRKRRVFEDLVFSEIAARRADSGEREDILSLLVAARHEDGSPLGDREILDHLVTMVVAGHETTAIAIAWACYGLHHEPATLARLRADVDALGQDPEPDTVARIPYLEAVWQEALRLWPMAIALGRKLARPFTLKGHALPAGVHVAVCMLLHFRDDLYPEPLAFRPERFLAHSFSPFEYIPFGGGARRCIGAAFAAYEMKVVLATLLSRFELRLAIDRPPRPVLRAGTMGPEGGVPMIFVGPRQPAERPAT